MYLIQYEKDNLKDYIAYVIEDDQYDFVLSCDNGFQQAYEDIDTTIVRLHYKFISYDKPLHFIVEKCTELLNKMYNTNYEDWTIFVKEKIINSKHIIYYYFYSNTYCISLKDLKESINKFHSDLIEFDESIYYTKIKKFKKLIVADIPFQSDRSKKKYTHYKLLNGHAKNRILTACENLKLYTI